MCNNNNNNGLFVCLYFLSDVESQLLFGDTEALDAVNDDEPPNSTSHSLWVDKYAPRHYTHLLSDDVSSFSLMSTLIQMYV